MNTTAETWFTGFSKPWVKSCQTNVVSVWNMSHLYETRLHLVEFRRERLWWPENVSSKLPVLKFFGQPFKVKVAIKQKTTAIHQLVATTIATSDSALTSGMVLKTYCMTADEVIAALDKLGATDHVTPSGKLILAANMAQLVTKLKERCCYNPRPRWQNWQRHRPGHSEPKPPSSKMEVNLRPDSVQLTPQVTF